VPKALGVIVGAVVVRCTVALLATFGAGLSTKERVFIALAWMPKATVQAALGSVPLDMIQNTLNRQDDPAKYDEYTQHGLDILTVAVFSILATAPIGLVVIQQLGPRWLEKEQPDAVSELSTIQSVNEEDGHKPLALPNGKPQMVTASPWRQPPALGKSAFTSGLNSLKSADPERDVALPGVCGPGVEVRVVPPKQRSNSLSSAG